jgi:ABC-type cobalamin transport system permease subunit
MSQGQTLFQNPLFRWGMPATGAAVAVAIAFLVVEDEFVRLAILSVATIDVLVVPQILKRVTQGT